MDIEKTLEEIKQTARREKTTDLKPISPDFYEVAATAAQSLEKEMMRIGRPRSVEYKMLEDELSGLVANVETVFMNRAKKVVNSATSGAFTMSKNVLLKRDADKLLPAEQELYEDVLKAILKARTSMVADLVDGDSEDAGKPEIKTEKKAGQMPVQEPVKQPAAHTAAGAGSSGAGSSGAGSSGAGSSGAGGSGVGSSGAGSSGAGGSGAGSSGAGNASSRNSENDSSNNSVNNSANTSSDNSANNSANVINENYICVRILKDLPEFMGEDKKTYQLRAQDEVMLPAANANLLIKRGVAMGISGSSEGNPES